MWFNKKEDSKMKEIFFGATQYTVHFWKVSLEFT